MTSLTSFEVCRCLGFCWIFKRRERSWFGRRVEEREKSKGFWAIYIRRSEILFLLENSRTFFFFFTFFSFQILSKILIVLYDLII